MARGPVVFCSDAAWKVLPAPSSSTIRYAVRRQQANIFLLRRSTSEFVHYLYGFVVFFLFFSVGEGCLSMGPHFFSALRGAKTGMEKHSCNGEPHTGDQARNLTEFFHGCPSNRVLRWRVVVFVARLA